MGCSCCLMEMTGGEWGGSLGEVKEEEKRRRRRRKRRRRKRRLDKKRGNDREGCGVT